MPMEIITKANKIIQRIGLSNKDGETVLIYPSKLNKKNTTYRTQSGVKKSPFYQFVLNRELIDYFNFKDYVYFYEHDNIICIAPVEPTEPHHQAKINARRQILLPKKYFDLDGKKAVILKLDMQQANKYADGCGVLSIEII